MTARTLTFAPIFRHQGTIFSPSYLHVALHHLVEKRNSIFGLAQVHLVIEKRWGKSLVAGSVNIQQDCRQVGSDLGENTVILDTTPSFTLEQPSTIDHQPPFLLFHITASDCEILVLFYSYVSYGVTQWLKLQTMVLSINDKEEAAIVLSQGHRNGRVLTQYDSTMMAHFCNIYTQKLDRDHNIVYIN